MINHPQLRSLMPGHKASQAPCAQQHHWYRRGADGSWQHVGSELQGSFVSIGPCFRSEPKLKMCLKLLHPTALHFWDGRGIPTLADEGAGQNGPEGPLHLGAQSLHEHGWRWMDILWNGSSANTQTEEHVARFGTNLLWGAESRRCEVQGRRTFGSPC